MTGYNWGSLLLHWCFETCETVALSRLATPTLSLTGTRLSYTCFTLGTAHAMVSHARCHFHLRWKRINAWNHPLLARGEPSRLPHNPLRVTTSKIGMDPWPLVVSEHVEVWDFSRDAFFFSILFCYQSIPLGWQGFQITNLDAFYPLFTKPYSPTQTKRLDFFFFSNRNLNKNRPVAHVVRGTLQWWYEYWCLVVTTPEHRLGKSSLNAYRGVTLYCFIRIRKKEIHVI